MTGRRIFRQAALDRLEASEAMDDLLELVPAQPFRRIAQSLRAWPGRLRRASASQRAHTPTVLQMEATECGAAALAMVLGYHGRVVTLEELREACGVSRDGSKASSLLVVAREHGLKAKGYTKELDGLRAVPLPCIVFWNFCHFVVVEGFGPQGVFVNDPATGPRRVSLEEFDAAFTGVVLVFEPGPDFRPGGQPFRLVPALRRRLAGAGAAILALALIGVALLLPGMAVPLLTGTFVDRVMVAGDNGPVGLLVAGLGVLVVAMGVLTWLQGRTLLRVEERLAMRDGRAVLGHMLRLPMGFFDQRYAGDIAGRAAIATAVSTNLTGNLASSGLALILVAAYLAAMLRYDVLLALIAAVGGLTTLIALRAGLRQRVDAQHRMLADTAAWQSSTLSTLQTIETVKASGTESDAFGRWAGYQAKVSNADGAQTVLSQPISVIPALVTGLTVTATLVVGGWRVVDGALTPGAVVAFQGLMLGFMLPFAQFVGLGGVLQTLRADLARLDDVLGAALDPELAPSSADPDGDPLEGRVELRGVRFGYSRRERPLIDGLDLTLPAGSRVALVGGSGSGKSTVARLLAGVYRPWDGLVLLDGIPRGYRPRRQVIRGLALVDQDIRLFAGSVQENLTLWDEEIPLDAVVTAARDAGIHDVIMALPGGYDAPVAEGGRNLSGGQRQRLEIARALVTDPVVLVLDEATSSLDPVTEASVMANLRRRGCTCLIVAHRLSTVRDADEIVVLRDGQIVQRGTHEELRQIDGEYRHLLEAAPEPREATSPTEAGPAVSGGARGPYEDPIGASSPLDSTTGGGPALQMAHDDALMGAFGLVADKLGVPIRPAAAGTPEEELIEGIARASRLRVRSVNLVPGWWRLDAGPLLGHRSDDAPVALLPAGTGRYVLIDPSDGRRITVNAAVAAGIANTATMVYRCFPDRPLGFADVLRFSALGSRRDLTVAAVTVVVTGLLALAIPVATGVVFSRILPGGLRQELLAVGAALVAATLSTAALAVVQGMAVARARIRGDTGLHAALWDRLLGLPAGFFQRFEVGDLGSRAMAIGQLRQVVSTSVLTSAAAAAGAVSSAGLLIAVDWRLAGSAIALLMGFTAIALWSRLVELRRRRVAVEAEGRTAALTLQLVHGILRLRVAGAEERALGRWTRAFGRSRAAARRARQATVAAHAWTAAFPLLATLGLYAAVGFGAVALDIGPFLAFAAAFGQCIAAGTALAAAAVDVIAAVPLYERVRPILQAVPEIRPTLVHPGRLGGAVRVDDVSFRYGDGPLVLDGVSLEIRPGECVALVGPSGSGKSTLLRVLLGFERPVSGTVSYDGRNLATLDAREVRRQIGVVLQHGDVTADPIVRNIIGAAPLEMTRAWEAAERAALADDIRALPMGMFTRVPEGGATFSGGQRQRLLIGRAFARRPRLMFFDEATSALDNATQAVVSDSLAQMGASRLVIAHRLSTVRHADRIVVLSGGRVVETGTYDELADKEGLFADLMRPQLA